MTPFLVWSLAAFHTSLLVGALVLTFHGLGTLGPLLDQLNTLAGLGLYVLLWGITWWTTGRALAGARFGGALGLEVPGGLFGQGAFWAGITGALFLLVVASAGALALGGLAAVPSLLVIGVVGAAFAFVVGAVLGAVLIALDLVLLALADLLYRACVEEASPGDDA